MEVTHRILANDGLSAPAVQLLRDAGFEVRETRVAQEQLSAYLQEHAITVLLVRSATQVPAVLIDANPQLCLIGRAGVGLDNIAVAHARKRGVHVINTPDASADSVAELVFAHLFNGARDLHTSNREMPLEGDRNFKALKKAFGSGTELRGKILGIIGFGTIGQAVARMAIGLGMEVNFTDTHRDRATLSLEFRDGRSLDFDLEGSTLEVVLATSDFITLHVPAQDQPLIGERELALMKPGSGLVNTARGGVVDEVALLAALDAGHLRFAALDVFESEPSPEIQVLMHPGLSLSPHIGGSTREAKARIGMSLAHQIISLLKK